MSVSSSSGGLHFTLQIVFVSIGRLQSNYEKCRVERGELKSITMEERSQGLVAMTVAPVLHVYFSHPSALRSTLCTSVSKHISSRPL